MIMARRRLNSQLFISYLVIILLAVVALGWFASQSVKSFYFSEKRDDLKARAVLVRETLDIMRENTPESLSNFCRRVGEKTATRITLLHNDGHVLADSHEDAAVMDNHSDRPEIREAIGNGEGTSIRYSHTLDEEMMYLAIFTEISDKPIVVRLSVPITSLQETLAVMRKRIIFAVILIAAVSSSISYLVSQRIVRPLEAMKRGADRFAAGDLNRKLSIPNLEETGSLAETLNEMASQLDARIMTILKQRNEREAILTSMVEGVVAIDEQGRTVTFNEAAVRLLGVDLENELGKPLTELVRSSKLTDLLKKTMKSDEVIESEIELVGSDRKRFVQVHGVRLRGDDGPTTRTLIVLNDISRLKRLEQVRRDFVANVSHELKTPITSIQGYVETLQDFLSEEDNDATHFLSIIVRQSERMKLIIDDLLHLSQIEDMQERGELQKVPTEIFPLLESAVEDVRSQSGTKKLAFDLHCSEDLNVEVNSQLFRQAVTNLLDNAVKYGDGSTILLNCLQVEDNIEVSVTNAGSIIAPEHRERLFERFYRIDKGRSREKGGTGLGLAIVKHITLAHGGEAVSYTHLTLPTRDLV